IKLYRKALSGKRMATVSDYANDFIAFLEKSKSIFPPSLQKEHVALAAHGACMGVWTEIKKRVEKATEEKKANDSDIEQIANEVINNNWQILESKVKVCSYLPPGFEDAMLQSHEKEI